MLSFRQIEVFRAVMITKTVSGAARLLNVSQPGLTRMLHYTQDKLGFSLFERVSGRLIPTQEAILLFEEIEDIHEGIERLDIVIDRLQRGEDMVFRVGASPSLSHHIVPRALGAVRQKFPQLIIQFDVLSLQQIPDFLEKKEGEYTVSVFPVRHPNIVSRELGRLPLVCVLPQDHPLSADKQLKVADIAKEQLISFRANTPHGALIDSAFQEAGVERHVSTYVRFAETACSFVKNGLGVAIVDAFTVQGPIGEGLCVRPIEPIRELPILIHRNKFANRTKFARHFEDEMDRLAGEFINEADFSN